MSEIVMSPSDFVAVLNQTMEYTYGAILLAGEVASYKVSQGKWVFFDLKDEETSVSCFMPVWSLKVPLVDGMRVVVRGTPKVTKWGKFSVTVTAVKPLGEGSIKKAFELLKEKLMREGIFEISRKKAIPKGLKRIGVISSVQAAGYADFVKILNARWGGMKVITAHCQVQGLDAPAQITRAIEYFNARDIVDALVIIRGGGSADDLSCFNDEGLVRAVAESRLPVMTGIGHEVDESLCDLAADVRASTPSNAAELLTYDRVAMRDHVESDIRQVSNKIKEVITRLENELAQKRKVLFAVNPDKVLERGYAILTGKIALGSIVKITTFSTELEAEIKSLKERN